MARNGAVGRDRRHLAKLLEPADDAPVDDRDTVDKEQIREPKGARLLVEIVRSLSVWAGPCARNVRRRPPRSRSSRVETRMVGATTSLPSASLPRASRSRRK